MEVNQSERYSSKPFSATRRPLRTTQISDPKDKQLQQQLRSRRDRFISQSSGTDTEVNSDSCLKQKQHQQKPYRDISHRRLDHDHDHIS